MTDPETDAAQSVALQALDMMVNGDCREQPDSEMHGSECTCHEKFNELLDRFGGNGLNIGINLWLANATHEVGGFMPGEMVTVQFADGSQMSEVEKEDPSAAWAARMLLAYISQNEEFLITLLEQVPKKEIAAWSFALLELCAVNIRAKVIDGEDISPKIQYIEIEDA